VCAEFAWRSDRTDSGGRMCRPQRVLAVQAVRGGVLTWRSEEMNERARFWVALISVVIVSIASGVVSGLDSPWRRPGEPRWWKGNLHTHTLWSDGQAFPETVVSWYKRSGYHFLALSDHNVLQRGERWVRLADHPQLRWAYDAYVEEFGPEWVESRRRDGVCEVRLKTLDEFRTRFEEPDRFLLLCGEEITDRSQNRPVHLNASNLLELVPPQHGETVAETIRRNVLAVYEQRQRLGRPILVHLNHPNYGWAVTVDDLVQVPEVRFFEVFNGHPAVNNEGDAEHPSVEEMWDQVLIGRLRNNPEDILYGLATDDAHVYDRDGGNAPVPGRGWIMVRARYLTPREIVQAIERGDFYASTGVTLSDIEVSADAIRVEVAPNPGASYTIEFVGARKMADGGISGPEVLKRVTGTEATYEFQGDELYVRCRVRSDCPPARPISAGDREMAWTQPVVPSVQ